MHLRNSGSSGPPLADPPHGPQTRAAVSARGLRGLCAAAANGVASGALLLALLDWGARGPHAWLAAYNMAAAGLLCAAGRRASARAWDAGAPGRLGYRRLSQTA
eukprot:TRINITY_DN33855_c0_g1_i2.p3 TRINITY_DN33855_c0_g1~~TRINITY_DN33855_c0_g1_i2.p3  ORF type:complete len:104 (+),score=24.86 TRINITY_DN33855_c0_g1_i2:106-417(+)